MPGLSDWQGEQVKKRIKAEIKRRLYACAVLVLNRARELISIPGTTQATGLGKGKNQKVKKKRLYNTNPSAPGDPPHKQKGHLRRSVAKEVGDTEARVGTNLLYGRWLELGTPKMAARPWLRRALSEVLQQIQAVFRKPMT